MCSKDQCPSCLCYNCDKGCKNCSSCSDDYITMMTVCNKRFDDDNGWG